MENICLGHASRAGTFTDSNACRSCRKYASASRPLHVPCVVHSCATRLTSGMMSAIRDGSESPGAVEQFSGYPSVNCGHSPCTMNPNVPETHSGFEGWL